MMPEITDYEFQPASTEANGSSARGPRIVRAALIIGGIAVLAVAGYFMLGRRSSSGDAPAAAATTASPQAAPSPGDPAERIDLPALDDSDGLVRQRVGVLSSHPLVSAWLAANGLIRNVVVVVDNVAHGVTPSGHLRVLRPGGEFRVVKRGDRMVADPRNYDRYSRIVAAASSIDPRLAARTYETFKPLLQSAYDELGNQEPSDRALERALVALLQVPAADGDIRLVQAGEGIGYEYEDEKVEMLTGAQKQLIRMGPSNVRTIQQQLRTFGLTLGIPAERLSSGTP
jgi:hypothetical protein